MEPLRAAPAVPDPVPRPRSKPVVSGSTPPSDPRRTRPLAATGLVLAELELALEGMATGEDDAARSLERIAGFLEGARSLDAMPAVAAALGRVREALAAPSFATRLLDAGLHLHACLAEQHPSLLRPRVLVVSADMQDARELARCLAGPDRLLAIAETATEARHLLERRDVALAVVDPELPDLDGHALLRLLRRRTDLRPDTLVVLGEPPAGDEALGDELWLAPPVDAARMKELSEQCLAKARDARRARAPESGDESYGLIEAVLETHPRYEVEGKLGEGGMGAVFLARERDTDRRVAVKVLLPFFARERGAVQRFRREMEILLRLDHPGIVRAYDAGFHGGLYYYAMELVEGKALREILDEEGRFPPERAIDVLRQATLALIHANRLGVVHRDVKPGNILIDLAGRAKLADLGLAKVVNETGGSTEGDDTLALGTPAYMSPEHLAGDPVDIRSDIYSLGLTTYEMLTGVMPFATDVAAVALARKRTQGLPREPAARAAVPDGLLRLLDRMCAADRDERHASPEELLVDVMRVSAGQRPFPATTPSPRVMLVAEDAALEEHVRATLEARGIELLYGEATARERSEDDGGRAPKVALLDTATRACELGDWIDGLRARPSWRDTTLVAIVPADDEAAVERAWESGVDDVLPAPFGRAELAARIRFHLRR